MQPNSGISDENKVKCQYFVNAWVDAFCVGGLSISAFFFVQYFHSGARTEGVIYLGAMLAWLINWPHFSATNYRLYQSADHVRQYFLTAYLVPVVVALGAFGSFLSPTGIAPWFVKLFLIWSPYHFSGQTFGISLLYARRAGLQIGKWERMALWGFVFGTYFTPSSLAETGTGMSTFYSVSYPMLGIPTWIPDVFRVGMYGSGILFFASMGIRMLKTRKTVPWIVFLPAVAQYIWFVQGSGLSAFQEFVPLFHGLQYLLIAWSMQLHTKAAVEPVKNPVRFISYETALWGAANFIGGVALFYILPRAFVPFGLELGLSMAIILSSVQIHHFIVDGVIWKLKNKSVASPLMSNFSELFSRPQINDTHLLLD